MAEAEVRLLDIAATKQEVFTRWDITGHQITRHLLSKELTGTPDIVGDHLTFPPGFIHHMHRHPNADMVVIPLSGSVQLLGESGVPVEVSPGHLLVIPRGNWHQVRNVGTVDSQVLHLFAGVGAVEDIGYEASDAPAAQGAASASLQPSAQPMRIAIIGMGRMGRALADRLLEGGHEVSVWNRTPGRAAALAQRGAKVLDSVDEVGDDTDAVFLCLADDQSTLQVATPNGKARASWAHTLVVNTGTVSTDVITALGDAYGDRSVNAPIIGAPQAVRSGTATFLVGGPAPARAALAPVWNSFAPAVEVGDRPETAMIMKILHNHMIIVQLAVIAETIRAGRAAGVDDAILSAALHQSAIMPPALRNRIDALFDPAHAGWFTSLQAVKDVTLALDLSNDGAPLPVTEAARDAYRQLDADGWQTQDITALVEYGRHP